MGNTNMERLIAARRRALAAAVGEELRSARTELGLSIRAVSAEARLHHSLLARVEGGDRAVSLDALAAYATAMGHEVSVRLFPTTGPRVRDHGQVRMIEALLRALDPRWIARLEVPVYRPARGVIDVVLADRAHGDIVAGEGHSRLTVVERQLRWAAEKADSLPSAVGWPFAVTPGGPHAPHTEAPRTSRLLLLRSCDAMHSLVGSLQATFRAAYPADTRAAVDALSGSTEPWPGAAIVWADVRGEATRILEGRPRALRA